VTTWPTSHPISSRAQIDQRHNPSTHTSGIHSAKAAYRGNDRPKPSRFIGRQSPASKGEKERLRTTVPIAAVHLAGGYERLIDSL
jgi:hypothetical protein